MSSTPYKPFLPIHIPDRFKLTTFKDDELLQHPTYKRFFSEPFTEQNLNTFLELVIPYQNHHS